MALAHQLPPHSTEAIYGRLSLDRYDDRQKVEGQVDDCLELAEQRGWDVPAELRFLDNDISASRFSTKRRPAYDALLEAVRAGRVDRILCWNADRLYRKPKELEALIELADLRARANQPRIEIVSVVGQSFDLSTGGGRKAARDFIAGAAYESDQISVRVRRVKRRHREQGKAHGGPRAFGWTRLGARGAYNLPEPREAELIRQAMEDVLAGVSQNEIARRWNAQGVGQPRGTAGWTAEKVRQVLTNPRHKGWVGHAGKAVTLATSWDPIVDPALWDACQRLLESRSTRTGRGKQRHLLTGLVRCGHDGCGGKMVTGVSSAKRAYRCHGAPGRRGCNRNTILAEPVEAMVISETLDRVDNGRLAARLSMAPTVDGSILQTELARLDALSEDAILSYNAGAYSREQRDLALTDIRQRRDAVLSSLDRLAQSTLTSRYVGRSGALLADWESLTVSQRQEIIADALGAITIGAARRGYPRFDPTRVSWD